MAVFLASLLQFSVAFLPSSCGVAGFTAVVVDRPCFRMSMSQSGVSRLPYVIKESNGESEVLRRTADFLSRAMYIEQMPEGQRKELRNLEFQDLQMRYGQTVGRRKFNSCLILGIEDQDIIGSIGCDCQVLNKSKKRFKPLKGDSPNSLYPFLEADGVEEVVCVMANLAVRRNRRGLGIAQKLISAAEDNVRRWGFEYLYLLVDSENIAAQKLYKKMGYTVSFRQEDATCVASGPIGLKTQDCVNLCMRKRIASGSSGSIKDLFQGFSNFFLSGMGAKT